MKKLLPYNTAFLLVASSMLSVTALFFTVKYAYEYIVHSRLADDRYTISFISGASATSETLDTSFLAEVMELSKDKPTNIHLFSEQRAEQLLKAVPLFQEVRVQKKMPDTLAVKYILREPLAALGSFPNTVIDKEGVPFPLKPYFSPKNLPKIYLEVKEVTLGQKVTDEGLEKALFILHMLEGFEVSLIDMRKLHDPSLGRRSITLIFQNPDSKHYVRLPVKEFQTALSNYLEMRGELLVQERDQEKKESVIDLRLPGYGYVSSVSIISDRVESTS